MDFDKIREMRARILPQGKRNQTFSIDRAASEALKDVQYAMRLNASQAIEALIYAAADAAGRPVAVRALPGGPEADYRGGGARGASFDHAAPPPPPAKALAPVVECNDGSMHIRAQWPADVPLPGQPGNEAALTPEAWRVQDKLSSPDEDDDDFEGDDEEEDTENEEEGEKED